MSGVSTVVKRVLSLHRCGYVVEWLVSDDILDVQFSLAEVCSNSYFSSEHTIDI